MSRAREFVIDQLTPGRMVKGCVAGLILYVGALILNGYPNYFPPSFDHGFLRFKEDFFYSSGYFLGFFAHVLASPIVLISGTLQMSQSLRRNWPAVHRGLGNVYVWLVLGAVAPGGLIMSVRALGGWSSTICFAAISILVWWFTFQAWRMAKAKRFADHSRWMVRSYILITSAVALRLVHFLLTQWDLDHTTTYQLAAWLSWVPALAGFEIFIAFGTRSRHGETVR